MTFEVVAFAYKEVATSAKLNQLAENILAHDHRADGSQGAPLVGEWATSETVAAVAGWTVGTARYRSIAGGTVVAFDLVVTRTGDQLDGAAETQPNAGNVSDTQIATAILPAGLRPASPQYLFADRQGFNLWMVRVDPDGSATLVAGVPGGRVPTGGSLTIRGLLWLG